MQAIQTTQGYLEPPQNDLKATYVARKKIKARFIHSPLMTELAAIEMNDRPIISPCDALEEVQGGQLLRLVRANAGDGEGGGSMEAEAHLCEARVQCPLCFDKLYSPVGMECGHVMCEHCWLKACNLPDEYGIDFMQRKRAYDAVKCAECNQGCMPTECLVLRSLDGLVRRRYTEDWERQKTEQARVRQELKAMTLEERVERNKNKAGGIAGANGDMGGGVGGTGYG